MKKQILLLCVTVLLFSSCSNSQLYKDSSCSNLQLYKDSSQPVDVRVENLLQQMTIAEKLGQMSIISLGLSDNPNNIEYKVKEEQNPLMGAYIYSFDDTKRVNEVQRIAIEESRLGIPALFGMDVIHGYRTIFPIPLAQACAWNPDMLYKSCRIAAKESYLSGIRWTFSPMVDVARDSRWGRVAEGYGEDPYASAVFAATAVKGYQGEKLSDKYSIASCLKHFAGYAFSEGGRDYRPTEVSPVTLWESVFPPYQAGIDAGAATVMSSFNDLNGTPTTADANLLKDILKTRFNFDGFVVSDWGSVGQLIYQRFAADSLDAGVKAMVAGTDMEMCDGIYMKYMPEAMDRNLIDMSHLDDAVRRILKVKFELGLFENPYVEVLPNDERYIQPESMQLAEQYAQESMVMLKNDNQTLPLSKSVKSVMLVGSMSNERFSMIGSWIGGGKVEDMITVLDGIKSEFGDDVKINYLEGAELESPNPEVVEKFQGVAEESDVIIVAIGESRWWSGENASRSTIALPSVQEQLVYEARKSGKPVVLLISSGRPIEMHRIAPQADAIIQMWQPGLCGGSAVAGILSGRVNPSGRLAITFPYETGQMPMFYNHRAPARINNQGNYQNIPNTPMYEFGYGLSYSTFEYGEVKLSQSTIAMDGVVTASVVVKNTSNVDGQETMFWFVDDPVASVSQPVKKLKHFEKVEIKANSEYEFKFEIDPMRDLSFVDGQGESHLEAGDFYIMTKFGRAKLVVE